MLTENQMHGLNIRCSMGDFLSTDFTCLRSLVCSEDGSVLSFRQAKRKQNHLILNHLILYQIGRGTPYSFGSGSHDCLQTGHNVTSRRTFFWQQSRNWTCLRLPKCKESVFVP